MSSPEVRNLEKPFMVGTVDIVLFASFVGVVLYWFYGRRKKTESALSQKLVLAPTAKFSQEDTSFIGKMKKAGKSVAIFYGSQTGTAEEFSGRLAKDAQRYGLKSLVLDPEECDMLGRRFCSMERGFLASSLEQVQH